ncbi:GNAT family N-acetyltransferase [Salidesulfovibrio onnuriiensis]|uniref:GNAT family N-acetyltransferase n=1 Tax=Salidesulfovibrio onnuriiensis TaxID=2583823 RepID=UPI0016508051|nr:GNAT family N-acetyltransferase [Salidesulfovibrio onnuriiensis]
MTDSTVYGSGNAGGSLFHIVQGLGPGDVHYVLDMTSEAGVFGSDELTTAEELAWECAFQGAEGSNCIIQARVDDNGADRPVGFICFGRIPRWDGNWELYFIVVDENYRGQGVGTALLLEMEDRVRAAEGQSIYLETGCGNAFEGARAFYEMNDFSIESRFCKQFIPEEGNVAYCKHVGGDEYNENSGQ